MFSDLRRKFLRIRRRKIGKIINFAQKILTKFSSDNNIWNKTNNTQEDVNLLIMSMKKNVL